MNLPSSFKELQALCEESRLKYKGKTKNALKTLLIDSAVETVDDSENDEDDIVMETQNHVLPKWSIDEWNIYEKIINKHETSTCKLEAWHQRLSKVLMKSHPSFEEFCKSLMGEWTKIDYEMEHLKNGYGRKDLKFNTSVSERKRKERIYNVVMNVNDYSTIVEYLDAMATASKK